MLPKVSTSYNEPKHDLVKGLTVVPKHPILKANQLAEARNTSRNFDFVGL